jgi:hypothetical protein
MYEWKMQSSNLPSRKLKTAAMRLKGQVAQASAMFVGN